MSDHSGLNDLVDQIKQVTTDIKAANTNFGQRLDSVEDNINTLFRKTSRPGPESGDVGFDRKEAFEFCKSRRAITVNTVEERDYSPSNAEVDQAISAQHALKAYLCHGDLDRLGPEHRKSLSAFSFGPPGNFLLPPTQANRVLSCLVYPTNLSGLVSTISISGPSLVFLIDNARFQLGTSTLILGGMVRANAAPITETYDFNVTFPAGAAFSTWDGSFTITFDPTAGAVGPSALDAFSSNLPAGYDPFVFVYEGAGSSLIIGDDCPGLGCVAAAGTDTAWMNISPVTASGGLTFSVASLAGTSSFAPLSTGGSLTPAATPLPATLPLFATGLGTLGLLGWFRKRKPRAVAA